MGSLENVDGATPPAEAGPGQAGPGQAGPAGTSAGGTAAGIDAQPVDDALATLPDLPLADHAALFERLHTRLQSALSAIDA